MITNSEFVDRCVFNMKANTKDGHISRRAILGIGTMKARFLISQKLDERSLFREDGMLSYIYCFELKAVTHRECSIFEFDICDNIMMSIKELPEGFFGKDGSGIVAVTDVDGNMYYPTTPRSFKNLQKRKYQFNTENYFTIKDKRLVLPNSTNELVDIAMFTPYKWQADECSTCSQGSQIPCKSRWDYEFVCPDRFLDIVVKDTLTELAQIYRTSIEDENGNMDTNIKSTDAQN